MIRMRTKCPVLGIELSLMLWCYLHTDNGRLEFYDHLGYLPGVFLIFLVRLIKLDTMGIGGRSHMKCRKIEDLNFGRISHTHRIEFWGEPFQNIWSCWQNVNIQ